MVTREQITTSLAVAGVKAGDHLFAHVSLRSIGTLDGGPDALVDALVKAVGADGTVAMPAYNHNGAVPTPYFDPIATPSASGALAELFRKRKGTKRSEHPAHSICAVGKQSDEFLAGHAGCGSFGVDSPLDRMARAGGWVLLVGVNHTASSIVHVGEARAEIKKFWWDDNPPPVVKVKTRDGKMIDVQLDPSSSCSMAFNAVENPLREKRKLIDLNVGEALSYLMRGEDVIDTVIEMTRTRPDALFCTRANCRPCRMGRSAGSGGGR